MFFVVNKEKLYAYIVSLMTVIMLFVMAGMLTPNNNTVETSANINEVHNSNIDKTNTISE